MLKVRDVGFSVAGLERTKFGFYRFQIFLIMVAIVISIHFKFKANEKYRYGLRKTVSKHLNYSIC